MPTATEVPINRLFAEEWATADTAWLRSTAAEIDRTSGNNNGKLGFSEVDAYVATQNAIIDAPERHGAQDVQRADVRISNAEWVSEALTRAHESNGAIAAAKEAAAKVLRGAVYAGVWTMERVGALLGFIKPI